MDSKFTTIFSSEVKPLITEEKDKYLAMASLIDVGKFVPDIDTEKNIDLLPIAFNAFVANRVNKNGDVVNSSTALEIYKSFINKPINIEHNRTKVIGTILIAGFSEFGTDKQLTEEEVKDLKSPFNVTLGAIVWKVVNDNVAKLIEEAGDPTSEFYQRISASWELGFEDYQLVILEEDSKNIENGEVITDKEKIEELKGNLKIFGGEGKLEDGRMIYRQVISKVIPLGIGLTEKPAADVKGVAVRRNNVDLLVKEEKPEDKASEEYSEEIIDKVATDTPEVKQNISQNKENNVIENKDSNMEIKSIKDITDKALEEVSASQISDFIEEELKKASEKYSEDQNRVEDALKKSEEEKEAVAENQKNLESELKDVKSQLETLEAEKTEREKVEEFNHRMASLDEQFVLSDEEREVIASDIKEMNNESFEGYQKKLAILMNNKTKAAVEEAKKEEENKKKEESKTEKVEASEEEEIVDEAMEQAEEEKESVPVTTAAEEPSVFEKYKSAFSLENFEIKL